MLHNQKQNVIFEEPEEKKAKPYKQQSKNDRITNVLPEEEIKEIVREAYKEGAKDALAVNEANKPEKKKDLTKEEKEGVKEGAKAEAQKKEEAKQKLNAIVARQDFELLRIKTRFPFDLFPD